MEPEEVKTDPTLKRRSNRASMPRRKTVGPLEEADPLAALADVEAPTPTRGTFEAGNNPLSPPLRTPLPFSPDASIVGSLESPEKDFSYLQRPENYYPLPPLDIPQAFRNSSHNPDPSTPLPDLLAQGHFRPAATLAAQMLCTSTSASDHETIFSLFYTRLSCLCLLSLLPLAATESKYLEDLSSSFYRDSLKKTHLVPWELRVLAVRLQGLGYSDGRRGVVGYYELARDARAEYAKTKDKDEKAMWKLRLEDLGIRVANALVEMGDLAGAGRHLESLLLCAANSEQEKQLQKGRLALLYLRIGNISAAKRYIEDSNLDSPINNEGSPNPYTVALIPLLSIAEGNYTTAVSRLQSIPEASTSSILTTTPSPPVPLSPLSTSNLAVSLLYSGQITAARSLLEPLVAEGHTFRALTFNLSTIYELCTDRSRSLKGALVERVAEMGRSGKGKEDGNGVGWEMRVVDFKL
ncbi:MAG: hypothetical protein MMC33_007944 [Icmadophila ericetorum]|nr:hypothetical protein [Icmadophila ericetorum]